jgi:hypothetical protein
MTKYHQTRTQAYKKNLIRLFLSNATLSLASSVGPSDSSSTEFEESVE